MAKHKTEIVFGFHAVESALKNDPANILEVWIEASRHDKRIKHLVQDIERQGIAIEYVKKKDLEKRCNSNKTQGVAARYRNLTAQPEQSLDALLNKDNVFLLVLDGILDPHNLGACLRTADAAGVDAVIAPKDRAVGLTPVVRKVACGAAESVPFIQVTNLARVLKQMKDADIWVVGTAGEADNFIYDTNLKGKLAIVMGAEEKGMRRLTRENCDQLIKLPMAGQVESLNVSVATGISLFEAVRQRS
ncbi:MAG: 23S rRNA (guanosine(2251)-2'-O)-methyltransferase RlmB [Gammaproteobacteria bacterium]|nr:23S rRNA (guanosine(2251)-2'-O)-methyltransferase RlmB [Gammaproteobacteria bacterium]